MDSPIDTAPLVGSIATPLLAGCLLFLVSPRRRSAYGLVAAAATAAVTAWVVACVVRRGTLTAAVGGWSPPLGIVLRADGLSAFMVGTTAAVGLAIAVYASARSPTRMASRPGEGAFWPFWFFAWSGLQAVFLSSDLFNLYVALEVLGISAVSLVGLARGAALAASIRYVLATLIGSLFFLAGVALIYAEYGLLDMVLVGARAAPSVGSATALALMTMGLALKSALFPLHFWLPSAHAKARAPVSALLSALVCEAPFYLVMRLWTLVLPGVATPAFAELVGVMAMAGIVWGSVQAVRQRRLKMLVAYSTVAQIGYLFLFVPLAMGEGRVLALDAAAYYLAAHACAKAAMFLAVGTFAAALGSDAIADLRGASVRLPLTTFSFALAGVTLVGVPPSGGFIAKWLLLEIAIEVAHWPIAVAIMLGSLLTAIYVFVPVARTLRGSHVESSPRIPVPAAMQIATFSLALAGVLLGVLSHAPIQLLGIEGPMRALLGLGGAT